MRHRLAVCAGYETHYTEWGEPGRPLAVLWHGLARTCRDHDEIAAALAADHHVVCPESIGRGMSQWAADADEYQFAVYERQAVAFVEALGVAKLRWVGTSMGGSLGIRLAAGPLAGRITHLVLNDMGPEVPDAAFDAILAYADQPPTFATLAEYEAYLRRVYAGRGFISDEGWRRMAIAGARRLPDGRHAPHYDPRITHQLRAHRADYQQWPAYDRLALPTLCLRGARSALLLPGVAAAMRERGPRAEVVEIPDCGHAPALNTPDQIGWVARHLARAA